MRKYAMVCGLAVIGCSSGKAGVRTDSVPSDRTTVAGPPAVTLTPPPDSVAAQPRSGHAGVPATDARTSPTPVSASAPPPLEVIVSAVDSVRGIVAVVGTDREKRVTIAPPGGGRRTQVTGRLAPLIGHVAGADVLVNGPVSGTSIEATSFIVRTVDGAPVIDGMLKTDAAVLYIVSLSGIRTRIASPPPPLLGHDGARVWISGDPARGISSFGFIDPPR